LVTREEASEDHRGEYAILTTEGVARFQSAAQAHMAFVRENFLGLFNEEELKQMSVFWKRLEEK
jgi:DNA-binding MarR family transcriptional regulator